MTYIFQLKTFFDLNHDLLFRLIPHSPNMIVYFCIYIQSMFENCLFSLESSDSIMCLTKNLFWDYFLNVLWWQRRNQYWCGKLYHFFSYIFCIYFIFLFRVLEGQMTKYVHLNHPVKKVTIILAAVPSNKPFLFKNTFRHHVRLPFNDSNSMRKCYLWRFPTWISYINKN